MLVQQTKLEIRGLVNEITQLSQSDCSLEEFYEGFLNRISAALASVGGAIWSVDEGSRLELRYQINMAKAQLADDEDRQFQHTLLLQKMLETGQSTLVQPRSGSADEDEAGNPTDFLLVMGVIKIDGEVQGVVEILQRPGGGPTTQRGYLRFLMQMCDLAGDYLKTRRLRSFGDRQQLWDQLEEFIHTVHHSLNVRDTVYTIANEGRRLVGADRVSVALCRGGKCKIEVVSGLDTIDRRAREIRHLGGLATAVVRGGQPLLYDGDAENLPPQIEKRLNSYVDKSHAKSVVVVPLKEPPDKTENSRRRSKTIAALVVEQFKDNRLTDAFTKRIDVVAAHSADALHSALEYNGLFLLPVWRALGKSRMILAIRNLPITLFVLLLAALAVFGLFVVQSDFDLSADGTLRPTVQRDIFAKADGTLVQVPVEPGMAVTKGHIVARLENHGLESEIIDLNGQLSENEKQTFAIRRVFTENPRMDPVQEIELAGKLAQLEVAKASIERQLAIYREQRRQMIVTSPIEGQVATWQVRNKLLQRPVHRGQRLMTLFNPAEPWELELQMPERRMGHVDLARRKSDEPLRVTFILATHPGEEFKGRVTSIDRSADVRDENGNTVRICVAIDKDVLPDLRDGAKVTARVHCGRRSFGYVWFHELVETIQAKVLFWF